MRQRGQWRFPIIRYLRKQKLPQSLSQLPDKDPCVLLKFYKLTNRLMVIYQQEPTKGRTAILSLMHMDTK